MLSGVGVADQTWNAFGMGSLIQEGQLSRPALFQAEQELLQLCFKAQLNKNC